MKWALFATFGMQLSSVKSAESVLCAMVYAPTTVRDWLLTFEFILDPSIPSKMQSVKSSFMELGSCGACFALQRTIQPWITTTSSHLRDGWLLLILAMQSVWHPIWSSTFSRWAKAIHLRDGWIAIIQGCMVLCGAKHADLFGSWEVEGKVVIQNGEEASGLVGVLRREWKKGLLMKKRFSYFMKSENP